MQRVLNVGGAAGPRLDHGDGAERDLHLGIAAVVGEDKAALAQVSGEGFDARGHVAEHGSGGGIVEEVDQAI